jgi:hypothetical protein
LEAKQERLYHNISDLVRYPEEAKLEFEPGSRYRYSNFGYVLLAYIAEKVTGESYSELIRENICNPIKLTNTKQYVNTRIEHRLASGYEYKILTGYENATYLDNTFAIGSGGIISTVDDMFLFDRALYTEQLLSNEIKDKMFRSTPQGPYGYGWVISKRVYDNLNDTLFIASHNGSVNGFQCDMKRILNDSCLILVFRNERSNSSLGLPNIVDIGNNILGLLYNQKISYPKKSIARKMALIINEFGIDSAIQEYYKQKELNRIDYSWDENELNQLGLDLFWLYNKLNDALSILEINVKEFPRSYNTYDSYAYLLMQAKEYQKSIMYYEKGFEVLEKYPEINKDLRYKRYVNEAKENIIKMESELKKSN